MHGCRFALSRSPVLRRRLAVWFASSCTRDGRSRRPLTASLAISWIIFMMRRVTRSAPCWHMPPPSNGGIRCSRSGRTCRRRARRRPGWPRSIWERLRGRRFEAETPNPIWRLSTGLAQQRCLPCARWMMTGSKGGSSRCPRGMPTGRGSTWQKMKSATPARSDGSVLAFLDEPVLLTDCQSAPVRVLALHGRWRWLGGVFSGVVLSRS